MVVYIKCFQSVSNLVFQMNLIVTERYIKMNKDFTVDGFAYGANISRITVYRMIKAGELFAYKVRNSTRIPYGELARLQQENQIKPTYTNQLEGCK